MDLKIYHDRIINTVNRIISNERDRSSDAGEDRESIGSLIEQIGVNKKAMAFIKALHKLEPEKREDTLRSFDALRGEFEKNWGGQKTIDMFEEKPEAEEPVEPVEAEILSRPSYGDDGHIDDDEHGYRQGLKDDDDFDAHLAEVAAQ
jgi:hypothetical protein